MRNNIPALECEFYVVRYVPKLTEDTSLNVGIILHCPKTGFLGCHFVRNFARIRNFHPQADLEFFAHLQEYFEKQIEEHRNDPEGFLQVVWTFSNLIQFAAPQKCATRDPKAELFKLFEQYAV